MEPVVSLIDMPKSWMFRLSTMLAAKAAARARCTCQLLKKVIDATWEPGEVPIPPHRRTVPLTLEQVEAQMPPQVESDGPGGGLLSSPWNDDYDEEQEGSDDFGRVKRMLPAFGPALTRLTANQALNALQGKTMLCWLHSNPGSVDLYFISNRYTLQERLRPLKEVTFKDNPEAWPPQDRDSVMGLQFEPFSFFCEYQTPNALRNPGDRWDDPGPHQLYTSQTPP